MEALRNRPETYSADGIPIYYNIYNEKGGGKLRMSLRFPKERVKGGTPSYGKIVYEEVHLLPAEAAKNSTAIQEALAEYAPNFWRHFFLREENATKKELFFEKAVKKEDGLPLAIVWAIDHEGLAEQFGWHPRTIQRKTKTLQRLLDQGWGTIPIGKLDAAFCGETLLTEFTHSEHCAVVALLKQLSQHEVGHKRLQMLPWPKNYSVRRPAEAKKSTTLVNQHIRLDNLVREDVHRIVEEMIGLLSQAKVWKFALALILVLAMGLSVQEICFIKMVSVICDRNNFPLSFHINGAVHEKKKRGKAESYAETSSKNRILPVPTKVAYAMRPLIEAWKRADGKEKYAERYLIPHDKNSQRRTDCKEIEKWINERLREQLKDNRMFDGQGNAVHPRTPYRRCLSTTHQSLFYVGFEADEFRYFFGLPPISTAGEFYCDFVNAAEQQRMRSMTDQWLGTILPSELCEDLRLKNPSAGTTAMFGAEGQIARVVLTLDIPPVPEEHIPIGGYQLRFQTRLGFSLSARSQPLET